MFQDLRSYLPQFLEKHGLKEQAYLIDVIKWLNTFLEMHSNEEIQKHARGLYVQDKCLYIGVTANAAAQELQLAKKELISFINEHMPDKQIKDIRCKKVTPSK